MSLFEIEISTWEHRFTPEQQDLLRTQSITDVKFQDDGHIDYGSNPIVSTDGLKALAGIKFAVRRVIDGPAIDSLKALGQRTTVVENTRCHVAVPGLGLLLIDEVDAAVDICTDALQQRLDDGWKILAICVQPDQRRPDYVLGRTRSVELAP